MSEKKLKVLIVEDETYITEILRNRLNKFGYKVIGTVDSGEKAIEIVKGKKLDLVLIDVILKGRKDGIETAMDIKEFFNIPIIFITGCCEIDFLEKVKDISPLKYLLKPFREKELYLTIKSAVNDK